MSQARRRGRPRTAAVEEGAPKRPGHERSAPARVLGLAIVALLPGCASAPLVEGGGLSSYGTMTTSDGLVTKSRFSVDKQQVSAAKTVRISPTIFPQAAAPKLSQEQRTLVANALDRALCVGLSDRFTVVTPNEPADLTVRAAITRAEATDEVAAGVSVATSLGMNFVKTSVPIPTPRVPIGMGSLSVEADAIDAAGRPRAAMLWARGATAFFSSPKVSKAGDAYDLAEAFGEDFGSLLVKGASPFEGFSIDLPSWHKIKSSAGFSPKHAACERHGRYPGIAGALGGQIGLPPEWTDGGAAEPAK